VEHGQQLLVSNGRMQTVLFLGSTPSSSNRSSVNLSGCHWGSQGRWLIVIIMKMGINAHDQRSVITWSGSRWFDSTSGYWLIVVKRYHTKTGLPQLVREGRTAVCSPVKRVFWVRLPAISLGKA